MKKLIIACILLICLTGSSCVGLGTSDRPGGFSLLSLNLVFLNNRTSVADEGEALTEVEGGADIQDSGKVALPGG